MSYPRTYTPSSSYLTHHTYNPQHILEYHNAQSLSYYHYLQTLILKLDLQAQTQTKTQTPQSLSRSETRPATPKIAQPPFSPQLRTSILQTTHPVHPTASNRHTMK